MEKVTKKEIRLTYYLNNDEDKKIYNELIKHNQPGRFVKDLVYKAINEKNSDCNNINIETLKLIDKLTDKIANLQISQLE